MLYLKGLINNQKAINNGSKEWKIQLNVCVKNVSLDDTGDIRTFDVWSKNEEKVILYLNLLVLCLIYFMKQV